ncbi:NUDIX hydrolase [Candidatus Saccharibacteria bacterium]|nr:NUDIX hydrolase [Candidatus Saccharibacteria bacterium]
MSSSKFPHGVIDQHHLNRKNDYLFRISMKSLIKDESGKVLVVKESGRTWWDLPGGGMDHDESIKDAVARELHEEVGLTGDFTYKVIHVEEPSFLEHANVWQVCMIFQVKPENMIFVAGEDGDETLFIDPEDLKSSDSLVERKVYEYSLLAE